MENLSIETKKANTSFQSSYVPTSFYRYTLYTRIYKRSLMTLHIVITLSTGMADKIHKKTQGVSR